ncbi:vomeronasal type-2 receptor 26-like [Protopterus annectens]|uniref:vomeronasal type-2 receptor 26-like n=1 Tax=Protopterus annectens TaxID=7888 RepID=UPI001CFB0134|nr:vomeronasal type-2 receptor 26-like [Protopterus annectens]
MRKFTSGSNECTKCSEDYWSNLMRDACFPKDIDFLSYDDTLGALLASTATLSTLTVTVVLCIFLKHRNTPVVKANNCNVSYFLIVTLGFCFLTALLFIGYPRYETCILRQTTFGIFFSLCVSSVLAKTIVVVLAFKATKPDSMLKAWIGPKTPYYIIILCSALQVTICSVWLTRFSPFPELNKKASGKIIAECNEGSLIMFYSMLGYLGLLAGMSFVLAFFARNLPDRFNEAKYITFSMIIFITVWLSFIPAYHSTKGKFMVATEIFAILSSSAAILICIFLPKCYIILVKTDLNTKHNLTCKQICIIKH